MQFDKSLPGMLAAGLLAAFILGFSPQILSAQSDADLDKLVKRLTGDFSSQSQSRLDSDYYDIRLHIRPIWTGDQTSHWLYVEQASATSEDKPYRQRIYKIEKDGEKGFKSIIYVLPEAATWVGAYKNTALFDGLKPSDLSLRDGCTVYLTKQAKDGAFVGSTRGEGCESNLRGAKYATSNVLITDEMLISWDQGFDAGGKQVWGATKGGYEFVRQQ